MNGFTLYFAEELAACYKRMDELRNALIDAREEIGEWSDQYEVLFQQNMNLVTQYALLQDRNRILEEQILDHWMSDDVVEI